MLQAKNLTRAFILVIGTLLMNPVNVSAEGTSNNISKNTLLHKKPNQRPTGDDPDTIEATIIGENLHLGLEEQTGQCDVTVTNSITGSSFQTTVSSANPVVYNVGTADAPLVITVETSDNISYEGVMMPE